MSRKGLQPQASLDPDELAALVRGATDEQLEVGLRESRGLILSEAFRQIPTRFRADRAADLRAVIDWRITGGAGGCDRFRLVFANGRCQVADAADGEADVTFSVSPLDFLKLISGAISPAQLFIFGRLRVRGNLMLAARLPGLFAIPQQR